MNIYLIGLPGSGKTTLGKQLAQHLSFNFQDMDEMIVEREGSSINAIFETHGESYFRKIEQSVLQETTNFDDVVISTGGGVPCFFDNMDVILKNGTSIYIKVSPKELLRRMVIGKSSSNRPMLKGKTEHQILDELTVKLREREPFYRKATYSAEGDNLKIDDLVKIIS